MKHIHVYILLALCAIAVPLYCLYQLCQMPIAGIMPTITNALLIACPVLWVKPALRWSLLIPVWLLSAFALSNYWYIRFLGDMIPLGSYLLWENVDSVLLKSLAHLIKPIDLVLVLPALVATVWFAKYRRAIQTEQLGIISYRKCVTSAIICLYVIFGQLIPAVVDCAMDDEGISLNTYRQELYQRFCVNDNGYREHAKVYGRVGFVGYWIKGVSWNIYRSLRSKHIPDAERLAIDEYLQRAAAMRGKSEINEKRQNLILIIVESLNSWVIDKRFGDRYVCPNIQRFLADSGTVAAKRMVTQVAGGTLSDGVFLYNVGMMPSTECVTARAYSKNKFYALPHILGDMTSSEVIFEYPDLWNHREMNKTYGYSSLTAGLYDYASVNRLSQDAAVFRKALEVADSVKGAFFIEITTLSMHTPFVDPNMPMSEWISKLNLPRQVRDYITVVNGFDAALAEFINKLKARGIYDNTLIVVASDHTAMVDGASVEENASPFIFFMALNSPVTRRIEHPVGQVDAFPTYLILWGAWMMLRGEDWDSVYSIPTILAYWIVPVIRLVRICRHPTLSI